MVDTNRKGHLSLKVDRIHLQERVIRETGPDWLPIPCGTGSTGRSSPVFINRFANQSVQFHH